MGSRQMSWPRRRWMGHHLAGAAALSVGAPWLGGCSPAAPALPPGGWVGDSDVRGHRVRAAAQEGLKWPDKLQRVQVLIIGAGVSGLAAARAFDRRGTQDVLVLDLEDHAGGNARGHNLGGTACPLGAHYLPVPDADAGAHSAALSEWLHEIGLLKRVAGRSVPEERHLAHAPQERVFDDGQWHGGLLAPAVDTHQWQRLMRSLAEVEQRGRASAPAFTLPAHRSAWSSSVATLDTVSFRAWLKGEDINDAGLMAHLDHCCRDDYGAGIDTVSAWAGVHYFASRHAVGEAGAAHEAPPPFTWPEGNAWLTRHLATPLGPRVLTGHVALQVREARDHMDVLAVKATSGEPVGFSADVVVLAVPLFVALRLLPAPLGALRSAVSALSYAPWLVANIQLSAPLTERAGPHMCWDNIIHGSQSLGYVLANQQSLNPATTPTVVTAYHALPASERMHLLGPDWQPWASRVLNDLATAHPDIHHKVARIELMRYGHAMAIPTPNLQRHPALTALRAQRGRLRFAHSDLAGYSVFEEAFAAGHDVAQPV